MTYFVSSGTQNLNSINTGTVTLLHTSIKAYWLHIIHISKFPEFADLHCVRSAASQRLVKLRLHDKTGCQPGWKTGWTTGWIFVYTMQPVVQPVWQPVGRPAVSCTQTFNRLSNRLFNYLCGMTTAVEQQAASCKQTCSRLSNRVFNRSENRLYRVNGF